MKTTDGQLYNLLLKEIKQDMARRRAMFPPDHPDYRSEEYEEEYAEPLAEISVEAYEEGFKRGFKEGFEEAIRQMYASGITVTQIAAAMKRSEAEIRKIVQ